MAAIAVVEAAGRDVSVHAARAAAAGTPAPPAPEGGDARDAADGRRTTGAACPGPRGTGARRRRPGSAAARPGSRRWPPSPTPPQPRGRRPSGGTPLAKTRKARKPGRTSDCRARVLPPPASPEALPHPLRFARSLHERHDACHPAEGSPSTTCAATRSDAATMTAPHPYAQGVGSRVSSSARACWCAASYPRAWRDGRRRSHSRQGVPDSTRAGGCPLSQVRITQRPWSWRS